MPSSSTSVPRWASASSCSADLPLQRRRFFATLQRQRLAVCELCLQALDVGLRRRKLLLEHDHLFVHSHHLRCFEAE